jgi:hypothetical protein
VVDAQELGVHQERHGPPRVEGAAMFGGHLEEEGVALDQADGTRVAVHHGDDQGVRLTLEALIDLAARRRRRGGRRAIDQLEDVHLAAFRVPKPPFAVRKVKRVLIGAPGSEVVRPSSSAQESGRARGGGYLAPDAVSTSVCSQSM